MIAISVLLIFAVNSCESGASDAVLSKIQVPNTTPTPEAESSNYSVTGHLIRNFEIEDLKKKGLKDPVSVIVNSLRARPDLIPFKGVLGGTMGFYSDEGIHLLAPNWVYAEFDDVHISGRGIFKYEIKKVGKILWKTVTSKLDE